MPPPRFARPPSAPTTTRVDHVEQLKTGDLHDLCDAADDAIHDGGGFGWLVPPPREIMERYWRGVLLVPDRSLYVGRLDGTIAGSVQLMRPSRHNEAQAHAATLTTSFVAPWARGHGLARMLTLAVEAEARRAGFAILNLDVRETQSRAIALYDSLGFQRWGCNPHYALVDGRAVAGYYYYKELTADTLLDDMPR
ncbi:MAG: GNAT family N-acetyltransferase [Azospirillum sp.]|nr:GNAT family N-acetyltransferase [Azospirillum sp.]